MEINTDIETLQEWTLREAPADAANAQLRQEIAQLRRELAQVLPAQFPNSWSPMPAGGGRMLVPLYAASPEYREVELKFQASLPANFQIVSIERNQDSTRWIQYEAQKASMDDRHDDICLAIGD